MINKIIFAPLRIARWVTADSTLDIHIPGRIIRITGKVGIIAVYILMLGIIGWL